MFFVEGVDYLARLKDVLEPVEQLTDLAMSVSGINVDLYRRRLELIKPNVQDLESLAIAYFEQRSEHCEHVISILKQLGKAVYIISAGNTPAVPLFARRLGVNDANVLAVSLSFDDQGEYIGFDDASLLVQPTGKFDLVRLIRKKHDLKSIALIGDGMNDLPAIDAVELFIGYGGHQYREKVEQKAEHYIMDSSFYSLLPLLLTTDELNKLDAADITMIESLL